jgi:hypothetical protein
MNRGLVATEILKVASLLSRQEYGSKYREHRRKIESLVKAGNTTDALDGYRKMSVFLRGLHDELGGVRMDRADEQRKLKNLAWHLRGLKAYTSPDRFDEQSIQSNILGALLLDSLDGLDEHVSYLLGVYDRLVGYAAVEKEFQHGPFRILNKYGYRQEEYAEPLKILDAAADKIRSAGFGSVLYGDVELTAKEREGVAGRYVEGADLIRLKVSAVFRFDGVYTLIHEFGHRYFSKVMGPKEREEYEDAYAGLSKALTLDERNRMWDALKRNAWSATRASRDVPDLADELLARWKAVFGSTGFSQGDIEKHDGLEAEMYAGFVSPKRKYVRRMSSPVSVSVTDYGDTKVEEDFAEIFAYMVTGKAVRPDAMERFQRVTGQQNKIATEILRVAKDLLATNGISIREVKKMARKYGADFFKGRGYFYFTAPSGLVFREEGVYVFDVNELTLEQWEEELKGKIEEARK